MSCDRCKRPDAFRSVWDVHVDFETMQLICSRCYVETFGLRGAGLSTREWSMMKAHLMAEGIVIDPVCKRPLFDKSHALLHVYVNRTYYFCSERCKRKFEASPQLYSRQRPFSGEMKS